jgi:hypothetical protein
MSSLTGETKSPSTSENVTVPTFYTNQLPPSTNLPNDPFNKSADLSKKSIEDISYSQRKDQDTCPHDRSENWNSNQCADCGHTNIGGTRVADEKRFAEIAKIEDHQYLVDQLSPVLGTMQVTHATKPGENAGTLGTGTLLELRESNTMAVVAFDCNPICRAILEQEKYEYVEQDQKCHVVLPCLELKEFKNCHARRIHGLGITIKALINFAYKHDCWNWTTTRVVRDIIVPATSETRCRYADLPELNGCFGPATVFMSHCWGATFGDLIGAACHGARKDRIVWIDIFAVRQWPGNEADLNFREVIARCGALVVSTSPVDGLKKMNFGTITDAGAAHYKPSVPFFATEEGEAAKKALPFFRLWCIVEIAAAIKLNVPIVVKGGSVRLACTTARWTAARGAYMKCTSWSENNDGTYNVVFEDGYTRDNVPATEIRVKEAVGIYEYDTECIGELMRNLERLIDVNASECAVDADKIREMAIVRKLEGGSEGVNALIVGVISGAVSSIANNILETDAFVCNEPESLRALNMPSGCQKEEYVLAKKILSAAGSGGRESVVKELLLKWGVKEDGDQDKEGEWYQYLTSFFSPTITNKWLIQLIDDSSVLASASAGGHVRVVGMILEVVGINVNKGVGDSTPLAVASLFGHTDVVKQLLTMNGIDLNKGHNELSPLRCAIRNKHIEIIQLLKDAGAEYSLEEAVAANDVEWMTKNLICQ